MILIMIFIIISIYRLKEYKLRTLGPEKLGFKSEWKLWIKLYLLYCHLNDTTMKIPIN